MEEDKWMEAIYTTEPANSSQKASQVVKVMRKMRKSTYLVYSSYNVSFQEHVHKDELMHGQSLSDSVKLVLGDPPYTVRSGCRMQICNMMP